MNTAELHIVVKIIRAVIAVIEMIDEKASDNPIVADLEKVIYSLHSGDI